MRILGLDLGTVRVGAALSDPLGLTAQPLEVIPRHALDKRVVELVTEYDVQRVIVGLPLKLDGSRGQAALDAKEAVQKLHTLVMIPVEFYDERLTSAAANRMLIDADVSRDKRKKSVDKIAAALILQGYLDRTKK
ncbi:MAG: Holliday junction resolvase RuvX [Clostridia bacterium]|nr:Holliday junction resolvase RuvX [Deltaproteobacteria bacterium]